MSTFFDLFSGIGGFRLALEREGHKHVGSCEINEYARKIYCRNFGKEPTEKDVRLVVDVSQLPNFDILTAGFPCQAFSVAGKRLGFNDDRGNLFFEIIRIVKEKRPTTILLENVKGLLSHDRGYTFGRILYEMDKVGYDVEWQVIDGKYFLPQRRERIYIVGHSREKPFSKVFPIGEAQNYIAGKNKRIEEKQSVNCIDANYWKGIDNHAQRTAVVLTEVRSEESRKIRRDTMKNEGRDFSPRRGKVISTTDKVGCITTAPTVEQTILENSQLRKLTPLECERLMGFPDGWTDVDGIADTQRYKCLGNSVIPAVIQIIIKNFD